MLTVILVVLFICLMIFLRKKLSSKSEWKIPWTICIIFICYAALILYMSLIYYIVKFDERFAENNFIIEYYEGLNNDLKQELAETADPKRKKEIETLIYLNEKVLNTRPHLSYETLNRYKFLIYFG